MWWPETEEEQERWFYSPQNTQQNCQCIDTPDDRCLYPGLWLHIKSFQKRNCRRIRIVMASYIVSSLYWPNYRGPKITQVDVKTSSPDTWKKQIRINRTFKVMSDLVLMVFYA
jgi:hypothetical protein